MMCPPWWSAGSGPAARRSRQARERHVHAERARAGAPAPHARKEIRRERIGGHHPRVEEVGLTLPTTARARRTPVFEGDACGAAPLHDDSPHRRAGLDLDGARGAGRLRHGLADRAHPADRVAPDTLLAVHLAAAWWSST